MGVTLQWREPPDRDARTFSRVVEFGRRRDAAAAYMSYSERVGPGVIVASIDPDPHEMLAAFADALTGQGLTALVPTLEPDLDRGTAVLRLRAAAAFLRDNWHPRVGAIGFGRAAPLVAHLVAEEPLDAVAIYPVSNEELLLPDGIETLIHDPDMHEVADPVAPNFDPEVSADAHQATVDFMLHNLS